MKKTVSKIKGALKKRADDKKLKKALGANDGALAKEVGEMVMADIRKQQQKRKPRPELN